MAQADTRARRDVRAGDHFVPGSTHDVDLIRAFLAGSKERGFLLPRHLQLAPYAGHRFLVHRISRIGPSKNPA